MGQYQGEVIDLSDKAFDGRIDIKAAQKDKALQLLSQSNVTFDPESPEAKRVLQKIDRRILPMIYIVYLFMLVVSWPLLTFSLYWRTRL